MTSALGSKGSTWQWRKIRMTILVRDKHRCQYCGEPADTVDHVVPRSQGGGDEPSNLVACCRRCQVRPVTGHPSGAGVDRLRAQRSVFKDRRVPDMPLSLPNTHETGSSGSVVTRSYTRRPA